MTLLVDGEPVVDLWGGWADGARTRLRERETLVNVWSTTKGPTALCAHILVDQGLLDLDAPVATYWPEFAAAGKEAVLVRHLLSHRAGLAGLREPHGWAGRGWSGAGPAGLCSPRSGRPLSAGPRGWARGRGIGQASLSEVSATSVTALARAVSVVSLSRPRPVSTPAPSSCSNRARRMCSVPT